MGDPPWSAARRYYRTDVRHTAGLTWDDLKPTDADDRELKRALRAQNGNYRQFYERGLGNEWPPPADADWFEEQAWWAGRYERNRRRREAVVAWFRGKAKRRRRR